LAGKDDFRIAPLSLYDALQCTTPESTEEADLIDVGIPMDELLHLEPFRRATARDVSPTARIHAAETSEDRIRLLDIHADVVAEVTESLHRRLPNDAPRIELANGDSALSALATVTEELYGRMRDVVDRSQAILGSLTAAELQGSTLREIVALLERLVGNPVILKDASHRVLAWSGQPADLDLARQGTLAHGVVTDEILRVLTKHGVLDRIRNERAAFRIEGDEQVGLSPRVICPVRAGDVQFGYLSVSEGRRELDALDLLAMESGATVVALHMARERAVEESMRSQHNLLLYDLLYSTENSDRRQQQASLLGFEIDRDYTAVAMTFERPADISAPELERWGRRLAAAVATTEVALRRIGVKSHLAMTEDDGVLLVVPSAEDLVDALVRPVLRDIDAHERLQVCSVGLSAPRLASLGLAKSYDEARIAAGLGRLVHGRGAITRYADLGVLRLLNEMSEDAVERHVDATLTEDRNFQDQFQETFRAYANSGYNKAAAARALFIHVNTLKYRLGRIKAVTGHDPMDHNGRFALECTLRLLELRRARRREA
jgi:PucR family transcriptional regulator, purine catabolism regulatory protein